MPTTESMIRLSDLYSDVLAVQQLGGGISKCMLLDYIARLVLEVKQLQLEVTNLGQQLSDLRNR